MKDEDFLKKQIQNLNKHLPKGRETLENLLKKDKPRVENRDGSKHRFKKKELEYLSELLPEEKHSRLRLPIIIRISPELGRGASKITGKIEKEIMKKMLDKDEEETEDELILYRPETRTIRKKLPTTTQYAFLISKQEGNPNGKTRRSR